MQQPRVSTSTFHHNGWSKRGSDYYYFSPSRGENTHIHIGGNTRSDECVVNFISLKVDDRFAGKIWDTDMVYSNWGALDAIDLAVASEFRKGLSAIGIY